MWNVLKFIKKHLVYSIPATMALGIACGLIFDLSTLKTLIVPVSILMIYPIMVTVNVKSLFSQCQFKLQGVTQTVNFLVIPFIGYGLGAIFFQDSPMTAFGLLLIASLPTSGMTLSWTAFARGNVNAAIKMTMTGLIAGTILSPLYAKAFMGQVMTIPLTDVFQKISIIIVLPLLLGYLTRVLLIIIYGQTSFDQNLKQKFPLIATLAVLMIIFIAIGLKARIIVDHPLFVLKMLIPLIIFYAANYTLTTVIGRMFFSRADAVTLVYGSVMRNLSVALAMAMTIFGKKGSDIALIIAVAYIIQVQTAAVFVKISQTLFNNNKGAEDGI
ncbi:MAG: bile acid:sodium symporter [Candidatus Omnitrophica bacterium]|nr:bile acid:sodium symporter [Candidatus Omnitrophota bacterium]